MKKQFPKIFFAFLIFNVFMIGLVNSAKAQTPLITPTQSFSTISPTPTLAVTETRAPISSTDVALPINPDIVTFSQLKQTEIRLTGPYDLKTIYFSIPADWALQDGIQLNLKLGVASNLNSQKVDDVIIASGGTLTIILNGSILQTVSIQDAGEIEIAIDIPLTEKLRNGDDISLQFVLDAVLSCRLIGMNTTIYIHPTSYFYIPHELVKPSISLVDFPKPIIQNTFFPDAVLLVIPDQPSAAELQAALTVSAGLGRVSWSRPTLDMTTLENLGQADVSNEHVILIGKAGSIPLLEDFSLPLPSRDGAFQIIDGDKNDGVLQMINSPWSDSHVILVVSGNTDDGVLKAAQSVSSGTIRPNRFENLALIAQVNNLPVPEVQAVDQTLSDLGYELRSFQSKGESGQGYTFNVPTGMTIGDDAYFDVVFGHSSLINYDASQIVILLNGQPIGSIRMSDTTADKPLNHAKIMLPPTAVLPGVNQLRIAVTLEPLDECIRPDSEGLWVNVWPESLIHLPLLPASYDPNLPLDISMYPAPFMFNSTLRNTAFVLEPNELNSWKKAIQVAYYLGSRTNGDVVQLSVFFGDQFPLAERVNYHIIVIGRPSQLPIIAEMKEYLPAPFVDDKVVETDKFAVTYRISTDSPFGFLETLRSPWNPENVILTILGNSVAGVGWAADGLIDSSLRWQLSGNFVIIDDKQIITSNTSLYSATGEAASGIIQIAQTPRANPTYSDVAMSPSADTRPVWILPVLFVSIGLAVVIVVMVIIQNGARAGNWSQRRSKEQ